MHLLVKYVLATKSTDIKFKANPRMINPGFPDKFNKNILLIIPTAPALYLFLHHLDINQYITKSEFDVIRVC